MTKPLTKQQFESEVFVKLKEFYAARLQKHLEACGRDQTPERTSKLRGQIAECRFFLAIDKEEPERQQVSSDGFP